MVKKKHNSNLIIQSTKVNDFSCDDWFWFVWINGQLVSADYLYTTCSCGSQSTAVRDKRGILNVKVQSICDPGNGGGGGGGQGGDNGGNSSATITNNVTNPCLRAMIDNIVTNGLNPILLGNLIQNIFGGNTQPALRFEDSSVLPGGLPSDIAARTDGLFHSAEFGGGLISATVYVNTDLLQNSSQEYIAATIIHEVMHSFFDSISNSSSNHEAMATDYFNFMTGSLMELFPSMAQADAEALTWGGLEKTLGYSTNVINNGLKSTYSSVNNQYKNKDLGAGCN